MLKNIPSQIGNAKPLFIGETDGIFGQVERDGRKIEIVFIPVCQYDPDEGYYLFGCDKDFNTHTDYYYDNIEDALEHATELYNPNQINWIQCTSGD